MKDNITPGSLFIDPVLGTRVDRGIEHELYLRGLPRSRLFGLEVSVDGCGELIAHDEELEIPLGIFMITGGGWDSDLGDGPSAQGV